MELEKFIKDHNDWKELLQQEPYNIIVQEEGDYILLKYNQISSDFNLPVVRECRGIILHIPTLQVVCRPFDKFGNYGEGYCPEIDWSTARVQEKIDGSLIKVWHHYGEWHVSTNGTIDAYTCDLQFPVGAIRTFGHLFLTTFVGKHQIKWTRLNELYTYLFEVVGPLNRVVVPYPENDIYHIGTRNTLTGEEMITDIGLHKPKEYNLHSMEEVVAAAQALPFSEEGYVVVDGKWNRAKVKSPAYVAIHHLRGEGGLTRKRVLSLVMENEQEEFLGYFPEYREIFAEVKTSYEAYLGKLWETMREFDKYQNLPRKEFAAWATRQIEPSLLFSYLDMKTGGPEEWLEQIGPEKVAKKLGY
jgi:hypothetical protein